MTHEYVLKYRKANPNMLIEKASDFDEMNQFLRQVNPSFHCTELNKDEKHKLYDAHNRFHAAAIGFNEPYLCKLRFAAWMVSQSTCSEELLLYFLSDRSFYFAEQRDLGNLPGDGALIAPAYGLDTLLLKENPWDEMKRTPIELLNEGITKLENIKCDDTQAINDVKSLYRSLFTPEPHAPISLESIKKLLHNPNTQMRDRLIYPYAAALENHRRARIVCEKEWIPTTAHEYFWEENQRHYGEIKAQILCRKDDQLCSYRLIEELNTLSCHCPVEPLPCRAEQFNTRLKETVEVFEKYVRSALFAVRKEEYEDILYTVKHDLEERPYYKAIHRLLNSCFQNEEWHRLTPLFLYHAFSGATKTILQCSKEKPRHKLVKQIKQVAKPARIKNMTSMTGRRAAINLVLYQKLKHLFGRTCQVCLLGRTPGKCADTPYSNATIWARIIAPQVEDEYCPDKCPFRRDAEYYNDWGFALTTGYGMLYHHLNCDDDIMMVSDGELLKKRDLISLDDRNQSNSNNTDYGEVQFPIWRYLINYRHPVGNMEGVLADNIQNCFSNRPRYLAPTSPNTYLRNNTDPLYSPYEELSALLLQDMHLPAMQRLSRKIKKLLSEHPNYITDYRPFLLYAAPTSCITKYLYKIIQTHNLMWQVTKYADYQKSGRAYSIRDSIQNILEYEIRAQIYDEMESQIETLTYRTLPQELFLYSPLAQDI
ncbi:hypothetical protein [Butyricicoccus sp. Marseille-Q5471]|uniref:hypothetical protein n=1 Tax=Butyricicoccus sp. Marseille-Q5471 TaxID=3039493 RepID=UPI0024BBEFFC|nr:hypothetical protein [Butyricicoccus sp. Marseille-Q5471]